MWRCGLSTEAGLRGSPDLNAVGIFQNLPGRSSWRGRPPDTVFPACLRWTLYREALGRHVPQRYVFAVGARLTARSVGRCGLIERVEMRRDWGEGAGSPRGPQLDAVPLVTIPERRVDLRQGDQQAAQRWRDNDIYGGVVSPEGLRPQHTACPLSRSAQVA